MNFPFYLILVNFNVKSHMWLLDSTALEKRDGRMESIFDPLIMAARGILRLKDERKSAGSLCSQLLPPSDGE